MRVLEQTRVAPPPSTPSAILPITFFDAAWLFTGPVERLFFYRHPDPASALPLLTSSLPHALRRFYPLAGNLNPSKEPFNYTYSRGDDALTFVVAESRTPGDFDRLVGTGPRDLREMHPLVPRLPPPREDGAFALAAVQVTVFPGRGLCLGVSVHHAACDDASATLFVRTWAAACRLGASSLDDSRESAPPPPVLDRSLVADPDDLLGKTLAGMKQLASNNSPPPPPPPTPLETEMPVLASFSLTRDQIARIKDAAAAAAAAQGAQQHLSSFVAASALAWVSLLKSRSSVPGAEEEGTAARSSHMLFSAECRSRLTPPLPAEYFGNCLRPCFVEAPTEDLLLLPSSAGVAAAALAIGTAVREMERGVLEGAEGWLGKVMSVLPMRPVSVAGSPRYGVYETDFGWGEPVRVELVSIEKTPGTVSLAESPDGDGGVEVGVVLPPHAMEAFASCFRI